MATIWSLYRLKIAKPLSLTTKLKPGSAPIGRRRSWRETRSYIKITKPLRKTFCLKDTHAKFPPTRRALRRTPPGTYRTMEYTIFTSPKISSSCLTVRQRLWASLSMTCCTIAFHARVFRGARISPLPTNACSTENDIPFPSLANHIVPSKFWKADLDRRVTR